MGHFSDREQYRRLCGEHESCDQTAWNRRDESAGKHGFALPDHRRTAGGQAVRRKAIRVQATAVVQEHHHAEREHRSWSRHRREPEHLPEKVRTELRAPLRARQGDPREMQPTQKLTQALRSLLALVEQEAMRNPSFAERLEEITAPLPAPSAARRRARNAGPAETPPNI